MSTFRLSLAIVLALLLTAAPAQAVESLDPSFGEGGISFPGSGGDIGSLAPDADGRLVSGGGVEIGNFIARYLRDGALDRTFGRRGDGRFINDAGLHSRINAVALQGDGKILAAGSVGSGNFTLTRYNADGSGPDYSFGEKYGRAVTIAGGFGGGAQDLALQPDGRILLAGFSIDAHEHWLAQVVRYRADGRPDRGFGRAGSVKLQPPAGSTSPMRLVGIQLLRSGKIVAAGDLGGQVLVVRLHPNGQPDRSFGGGDGGVLLGSRRASACACTYTDGLEIDRRGRILIVANAVRPHGRQPAVLIRLRPNGKLDRSFGRRGFARTVLGTRLGAKDIAIQGNGRIVLAGTYNVPHSGEARVAAVRFLPSGRIDRSFARRGFFVRDFGYEGVAYAAVRQRDGAVVIGGRANPVKSPFFEAPSIYDTAEVFLIRFLQ